MTQYRKKPAVVDAWRIERHDYPSWVMTEFDKASIYWITPTALILFTPDGTRSAPIGDWLIRDETGALWPVSDDVFRNQYEEVDT